MKALAGWIEEDPVADLDQDIAAAEQIHRAHPLADAFPASPQ